MATVKPILRIFDFDKAVQFYVDWLGFTIDWEHRIGASPVYLQISFQDITLHLSEHHGDCTPGARVFIDDFAALAPLHQTLLAKNYNYNRPAIYVPFYDEAALEMTVHDPFGNRLTFVERNAAKR
jgi:catechol 2,3-dioxygenase-like lactoylglutathione lyase family enzyme